MCGIAGIVGDAPVSRDALAGMLHAIRHRGPDGSGTHVEPGVGLGHVRLSIVDLEGGAQPMANEDGSVWITFNGEIFNYLELREDLLRKGHRFATSCDTEVIVHAYEEYGLDCVHRFNGQWAFALWDAKGRRLILSRDRLGVRPLFYTEAAGRFLFASEIKALFALPEVPRKLDLFALAQIFTFWVSLPPRTIFQNVHELPPGHNLIWERGHLRIAPYWRLDFGVDDSERRAKSWQDELAALLEDATRVRLRADVPVGAYLSGGLDSTLTTALVRRCAAAPPVTYSIAFADQDLDESRYQQEAAAFLGLHPETVLCRHEDIGAVFPDVIRHTEKPILRTAPAPLYLLAKRVRENNFKVVVTGEGADEVLGGYDIFKEAKVRRFWARNSASGFRASLLQRLYPYLPRLQAQSPAYLQAFFRSRTDWRTDSFFSHQPRWEMTEKLRLFFSAEVRSLLRDYDPRDDLRAALPADFSRWSKLGQAQYLEAAFLLPGYILSSQGDRVSMAHAVEGRFPFLDYRIVELAGRMPARLKLNGLEEKAILKDLARDLIPESIRRRPKQPYRAPDAVSFFGTPQKPVHLGYVEDLLSEKRVREGGVFDADVVGKLVRKATADGLAGARDNMALVGILSTQLLMAGFPGNRDQDFSYCAEKPFLS